MVDEKAVKKLLKSSEKAETPEEAIEFYNQALQIKPEDLEILWNKGEKLVEINRLDDAVETFAKALNVKSGDYDEYVDFGLRILNLYYYGDTIALQVADKLLSINPDVWEIWWAKGEILAKTNNLNDAVETFTKALNKIPGDCYEYAYLADKILSLYDNYGDAIALKVTDKALAINPDNCIIWWTKGKILDTINKSDDAVEAFAKALNVITDNVLPSYDLDAKFRELDETTASQVVNKALKVEIQSLDFLLNKARFFDIIQKSDEAVEVSNEALRIEPDNIELLSIKAKNISSTKRYEEAVEVINEALKIKPENTELLSDKYKYLLSAKEYDEALKVIDEILKKNYDNTERLIDNTGLYIINDAKLLSDKSKVLSSAKRYDEALVVLDKILETNPDNVDIWIKKIKNYNSLGRHDLATENTDNAYSRFYNKGIEYYRDEKFSEAFDYFDKASRIKNKDADVCLKKGDSQFQNKSYGLARIQYNKATKMDQKNAEAWYKKGLALKKEGQSKEAEECIDKALKIDPHFTPNFDHKLVLGNDNPQFSLLEILLENKKQVILYGSPGTGKTYLAQKFTEKREIKTRTTSLPKKSCLKYVRKTTFITFHQSYAYEEFIEGLRPLTKEDGSICYEVKEGIFKQICRCALNDLFENCDIEKRWEDGEDIPILPSTDISKVKQLFSDSDVPKYYLIIDEINRGDISRIFGELITILETDKRMFADAEIITTLPYSNKSFGIPPNIYLIGTMNTADKSIALIDIALRRRFSFIEMMPDYDLLEKELKSDSAEVQDIFSLGINSLRKINERIENNYDRDHLIGHSYLLKLKGCESEEELVKKLKYIFYYDIIPLLQEYYYDSPKNLQNVISHKFVELKGRSFKINENLKDNDFIDALRDFTR